MRHTIVLFSHKEDLGGESLMDYIYDSENKALGKLVAVCVGKAYGFNNRAKGSNQHDQVKELMVLIEGLMMEKGDHYTNELYSLVTESECGYEQSEERLEDLKGSLKKYMEMERPHTTIAKENCLKIVLICIWLSVRLLILIFCVLLRICKFFYCLFYCMCNLF